MSSVFFQMLSENFGINLSSQQKDAVLKKDGPALILACPGSGKTTVMVARTYYLVKYCDVNPKNILTVTFSKASAQDMKDRFNSLFGDVGVNYSTIHSFSYYLLRQYFKKNNIQHRIIEEDADNINKFSILKDLYLKHNGEVINDDKLEELVSGIGYVKNMLITDLKDVDIQIPNFEVIFKQYEEFKRKNNYIDYDDMLTLCLEVLSRENGLLKAVRNQIHYIQVDEAQDTSKVQHEIIKLLAAPLNNVFMVADDDQSIYGFRGSFPQALLDFSNTYPGAKVYYMEQNFRSSKSIVSVSNKLIKNNSGRYDKNIYTENGQGIPIRISSVFNEREQVKHLISLLEMSDKISDNAVLYRNNLSAIYLMEMLDRSGIVFYVKDYKQHFFRHWVTQDILAMLQFSLNQKNVLLFERFYYKINSYLNKQAISMLKQSSDAGSRNVFDILKGCSYIPDYQKVKMDRFSSIFGKVAKETPVRAIECIEYMLEYRDYLEKNGKKSGYSLDGLLAVLNILKLIAENTKTVDDFIKRVDELKTISENARFNKNRDAVILSTLHSAKGLEFKNVYMVDLVDGQFPGTESIRQAEIGDCKSLEEERRLFYVGMTRAKLILNLFVLERKNETRVAPSRFVDEVNSIINPGKAPSVMSASVAGGFFDDFFNVGDSVRHKMFGPGKVLSLIGDMLTVNFEKNGVKNMSVKACMESNLLSLLDA